MTFSEDRLIFMYPLYKENEYQSILFGEEDNTDGPFILWRHDIDIQLAIAAKMAQLNWRKVLNQIIF
jgi:hypothetical protein